MKLIAALALLLSAPLGAQAQAVKTTTGGASTARVIVKYKADSTLLRKQILAAGERQAAQAQALGARVGLPLRAGNGISDRSQVVFATGMTSEALAARLASEKDVEYAVPDRRKKRAAAPNDTLYRANANTSPAVGQWYLRAPSGSVRSAINAEAAWNVTTGSASMVVAVLDTGVRFDHPDLAGKLLPGYDFVDSDYRDANGNPVLPESFLTSKDGNGYDANASDEGDGITETEANEVNGLFEGCTYRESDTVPYPAERSSWHGTQVSGLIGALTNNGIGMASVGRNVRVLPVRVLAKCGGWDSDILAGMRWAAGISVPGATDNPTPAKVLNLSLGGGTTCSPTYRDAVDEINAMGAVIVASAGNLKGRAVAEPASCDGVIGVGGLRHEGDKVGYSNIGPELTISAPAGNCVNLGASQPCLYPILTTANSGSYNPVTNAAGGSIYTGDGDNATFGTSFSAPLVAGTVALMLSVRQDLSPTEVRRLLMASARSFPRVVAANCRAPGNFDQTDCNCTTSTCGAGMLDASGAVTAAQGPVVRIVATPSQPVAGRVLTLDGLDTSVLSGRSVASYRWVLVDNGGIVSPLSRTTADSIAVTPSGSGIFVVSLTVTDSTGASGTQTVEVSVASAGGGGGGGGALGLGWLAALLAAVAALARRPRPAQGG
jgi:serine protease